MCYHDNELYNETLVWEIYFFAIVKQDYINKL